MTIAPPPLPRRPAVGCPAPLRRRPGGDRPHRRAVAADQWLLPTPCEDWETRALTNHVVGGLHMFATALAGGDGAQGVDADWLGADPGSAFAAAARVAGSAWHAPDAPYRVLNISLGPIPGRMAVVIHLTEVLVHGVGPGRGHRT